MRCLNKKVVKRDYIWKLWWPLPYLSFALNFLLKVNPVFLLHRYFEKHRNKKAGKNCKIFRISVLFYLVLSLAILYCNKDNNRWCVAYTGVLGYRPGDYRLETTAARWPRVSLERNILLYSNNTRHIPGDSARLNTMRVVSIIASVAPDYAFQLRVLLYHLGGD